MDFAKKQLEKYGWTDGKGLGKNEDGIAEALRPKLKFDNAGIGHDVGEQFTNNWWERVFNNAAKNINVKLDKNEVTLELQGEAVDISTKSYSLKDLKNNTNLELGTFIKTELMTESGTRNYEVKAPEPIVPCVLTDEELFAACGGRTAHKGARHGLKLNGKLSRIEKQEKLLLKKMRNVSLADDTSTVEKKLKKLKKHKEETTTAAHESDGSSSSSKKIKNKRKSVTFNDATVVKYYTPDLDSSRESNKDENSNNAAPADANANANACDEGIEQDFEETSEFSDSHKSFEESQRKFDDLSKAERKKLKKKRKLEKKKTATALFLEEVREQMCIDESGKKRKLVSDEMDVETKQSPSSKHSKKKKFVPEKIKKKERRREKRMMKLVESLDFCKISDED